MHIRTSFRFAGLVAAGILAALMPQAARSQTPSLPLQPLPLNDLSAFRPAADNWSIVGDVYALPDDAALHTQPGTGVLVNAGSNSYSEKQNLFTRWEHGDLDLELDYMMPKGSNSGIYLQGRYEVQLFDSWGAEHPTYSDAGGIYQRWDDSRGKGNEGYEGIPPLLNVSRAPGLWNHLHIVFQAPRFDAQGRKTANARFLKVELNGATVQDNVEVTGPTRSAAFNDEQATGPLMIQGDHGSVAFRNIRYKLIGQDQVTLANLKYELRNGVFKSTADYRNVAPVKTGAEDGLRWDVGGVPDTFALTHTGTITIPASGEYLFTLGLDWIDDDPHFTGKATGGADLIIGGKTALHHPGGRWMTSETVNLEKGTYPFTLTYFKNRAWTDPSIRLTVEGPTVAAQILNAPGTFLEPDPIDHIIVHPAGRTDLQRSFIKHYGREFVDAVNVGEPSGINYALDLASDALLYVWKGGFIDATDMWHSRGNEQIAIPLGSVVNVSPAPSVAVLASADAPWPDSLSGAYPLKGYTLDPEGRPTFLFVIDGIHVADRITPGADGRTLTRRIDVQGPNRDGLWVRLATGDEITLRQDGFYDVDGRYYVQVPTGVRPTLRTQDGHQELLLPVKPATGKAGVEYTLIW